MKIIKKPTYQDFRDASPKELQKTYKLNQRELEQSHRKYLYGATQAERRKEYEMFYRRNRKDI